jgi:hypothetical protein
MLFTSASTRRSTPRIAMALCSAAAGCATVTFKPGVSPDGMAIDEHACREADAGDAAYVACMRERGWFVGGKSAQRASAVQEQLHDRQAVDAVGGALASDGVEESAATASKPQRTNSPSTEASAYVESADRTQDAPRQRSAAPDPLARIHVSSWWKLGAGPDALGRAVDACLRELGDPHRPDPAVTEVTVGFRDCLRGDGWFAVGASDAR